MYEFGESNGCTDMVLAWMKVIKGWEHNATDKEAIHSFICNLPERVRVTVCEDLSSSVSELQ